VNEEYEEYKERKGDTAKRRMGDAAAVVGGARLPNVL